MWQHIIDDFREAYFWLRQNTPEDAKIMSWWDYGYQITGMANRYALRTRAAAAIYERLTGYMNS